MRTDILQYRTRLARRALSRAARFFCGRMIDRWYDPADQSRALDLLGWSRRWIGRHVAAPPSKMHRWLAEQLDAMRARRPTKINLIGPRGGAKSTIATLAYVLRTALERTEPYIWIVSDTKAQAQVHLENVQRELVDNLFKTALGRNDGPGDPWRASRITLKSGATIEALGVGQNVRGRRLGADRPTLIVCDDIENDAHMRSARRRSQSREWFHGTLLKAGSPETNVVNLATALHRDALAMQLVGTPGWTSRVFASIETWPERMDLWSRWEAIYCNFDLPRREDVAREFFERHQAEMELGAELLWPEREDLYQLMAMRLESGRTAFEREKQGAPVNPEHCEWPDDYFGDEIWFDQWPAEIQVRTIALDPSKGTDARHGDYSAFVMLAVDRLGVAYLQADLARRPTPRIVEDGVRLVERFRPDAIGVESNQFQSLLADDFREALDRAGLISVRPWTIDNHENKQTRIRRLGPLLSTRRLRFKSACPSTRLLVDQLRDFPIGDHDDGPDAAEMAIRLAEELLSGKKSGDERNGRMLLDVD